MTTRRAAYSILIICLAGWLAAVQPKPAWAQGPVVLTDDQEEYPLGLHLDLLADPSQALTIDQVASPNLAAQFTPSQTETPNFGYTRAAIWARSQVSSESTTVTDWRLEIGDPTLDSVDLYLAPLGPAGAPTRPFIAKHIGDWQPFVAREVDETNFVFKLPLPPHATYVMYLRVVNRGSTPLDATIWSPEALARHNESTHLVLGFFYGFIFIMACYNLFLFFFLRDRAYLYYVICMVGLGLYSLSLDGLARQYLWPNQIWWGDIAILEGTSLALGAGAGFSRNFLSLKRYSPWLDKATLGLSAVAAGLMVAGLWPAAYPWVSQGNALLTLAAVVIGIAAGLTVWRQGYDPARYYLLAWTGLLMGAVLVVLGQYTLLSLNFFTTYGLRFGVFLLVLLLSLALADRINLLKAEAERANMKLRESEKRVTEFLEVMPVGVLLMDSQTQVFYINQEARHILQLPNQAIARQVPLSEVLARFSFYVAHTGQVYPLNDLPFMQALQGRSVNIDDLEITLPGGRVPLEVWANPIFDAQGQVNYAIIAFRDITGRQEITAELNRYRLRLEEMVAQRTHELALVNEQLQQDINRRQQAETELRKLSRAVEQSASTIVITDLSGVIEFVNPAFTRITGYLPAEALGQNPRVLKSGKMPPEIYRDLWATITRGDTWQGELLNRKKNGEFYWEFAAISPVKDKDGQTTHYVAVKEDITARKRTEALLQESNQKLQTTNARLAVIQEIGKIVTAQLHLDTMLEILTQSTTKLFGADAGAILLLDESGQILTIRGAYGLSEAMLKQSRCRVGEGIAGQVVQTGEAWLSNDLPHEPGFDNTAVDEGLLASVGVPLIVGDAVIGALIIYSKTHGDTFDQEELYFLRLLTGQAAIAIDNARLFEAERQANLEVQRKAERLNVLNRVSTVVSMSLQLDEVLPPLLREMVRILETSLGLLALREDGRDRYRVRTRFGLWQSNLDEVDWQTLPLLKIIERTRSPLLITNAATDERLRPLTALIEQEHIRTVLLLPLVAQNQVSGFILLGVINQERAFEAAEVELARTLTNQAAIAVEKARLYEATVTRYEQEQEIARQIQQNLLPRIVPQIPGLRLAGLCLPALATGGDFYDYVPLPDYRLGIVVSDVSGKSLPAAMVMALARNTIRAELLNHLRPDEAITAANRWLCQDTQRNTFIATLQVVIDSIRPTLWLVSAGQTAPLLRRQGQITYLSPDEAIGLPLGIVPDLTYHQAEISLYPGDTLLFYTDGLVEAKNKAGELFGFDRLEAALLRLDNSDTPQQIIDLLLAEAQAFVGEANQHDDITMVVVQIE